jgi:hypothetical protein
MKPRTLPLGTNGLVRMRSIPSRTSPARSGNAWNGKGGREPASAAIASASSSSLKVGHHAARVTNDVGFAFLQAENAEDIQPRVHAGDNGEPLRGSQRKRTFSLIGDVTRVVLEIFFGDGFIVRFTHVADDTIASKRAQLG